MGIRAGGQQDASRVEKSSVQSDERNAQQFARWPAGEPKAQPQP